MIDGAVSMLGQPSKTPGWAAQGGQPRVGGGSGGTVACCQQQRAAAAAALVPGSCICPSRARCMHCATGLALLLRHAGDRPLCCCAVSHVRPPCVSLCGVQGGARTLYALGANRAAVRCIEACADRLVCSGDDGKALLYSFN